MNEFKFLKANIFEYQLNLYELVATSIHKEIKYLESEELTADEMSSLEFYKQSLHTLVKVTFLQIYAQLEDSLYYECKYHVIKKNASIIRFETALREQGYNIDNKYWKNLLHISKIRNCLLHGNGRIDNDKYGVDTQTTINSLNSAASTSLIDVIDLKETSKIKLNPSFLHYCLNTITHFIEDSK